MLKKILVLLLLLTLLTHSGVQAQEGPALSYVEVNLWPEFDRPEMLVIYRITLSPQTSLPVEMSVRIPTAAGEPNAVAARQPDGSLINIPFTQNEGGEWSQIVFQATTLELQIEYYDPTLTKEGMARHFEYHWPGDYAAESFMIQVQQPAGASEMFISPSLGAGAPAADGLVYYTAEVGPLTLGQSFSIIIDYQKATDETSSSSVPIEPSGPLDDTASGRLTMVSALPWLLGGLGLLLLVGGWWYWQSGRDKAHPKRKRRSRHKSASQLERDPSEGEHVYCHQCGKRATPGDRFCRTCGTQLRLS